LSLVPNINEKRWKTTPDAGWGKVRRTQDLPKILLRKCQVQQDDNQPNHLPLVGAHSFAPTRHTRFTSPTSV